jgi:hypothetical protein
MEKQYYCIHVSTIYISTFTTPKNNINTLRYSAEGGQSEHMAWRTTYYKGNLFLRNSAIKYDLISNMQ